MHTDLTQFPLTWIIFAVIIIIVYVKGLDMGTHADTGRKVKSLNTSEGKRIRQRRAYYKRMALKNEENVDKWNYYVDKYNNTFNQ